MLSSTFLVPYLGQIGSYILLGTALLVLLMLVTNIPFSQIPDLVRKAAQGVWTLVLGFVKGVGRRVLGFGKWVRPGTARRAVRRKRRQKVSLEPTPSKVLTSSGEDISEIGEEALFEAAHTSEVPESASVGEDTIEEEDDREEVDVKDSKPEIVALPIEMPRSQASRKRIDQSSDVDYTLPDLDLLNDAPDEDGSPDREHLLEGAQTLERSLASFGIEGKVMQVNPGPVISCYEVQPPPGVKVNRIVNLADDLALVMKARGIRIQAPIPGKAAVGVEVPNKKPSIVYLKEILESGSFQSSGSKLMLALGKTAAGEPFCTDLAEMPHLLIAGATGSGKSVCINALITSILVRNAPEKVRFMMVDPKMLELTIYDSIPHLLAPVVTEPKKAAEALKWAVAEMEHRYRTMASYSVRNILDFNRKLDRMRDEAETEADRLDVSPQLPYIVVVIDELADLMMTAPTDIEDSLARLAQMARAVGIHLILATQRPSVNVITGTIKANFPSRIAFRVASKVDSRTILDANGAEKLLGRGDMLFMPSGKPEPIRIHGANMSTEETERLVKWVSSQGVMLEGVDLEDDENDVALAKMVRDERFDEALRLVVMHQQGSASLLQRRMKVGYARAARLIDELEQAGIVGPSDGSSKGREVLVGEDYLEQLEEEASGM
jgi:S-DNA-T family DNA segregation ATPase FtsK/SpoIIIE